MIDLNADLGESFGRWSLGDDEAMLAIVTSANIACGFHAGDASTLRAACAGAVEHGVTIGAQVSYRDLAGFGRRFIDVPEAELADDVLYQIAALDGLARAEGGRVRYVKPHGALYHATVDHEDQARAVVAAITAYDPGLAVLGLPGSLLLRYATDAGLRAVREAFADRAYHHDGTLVSRREEGAVLHDPDAVAQRVVRMVTDGEVEDVDGGTVRLDAASVCLHGDSPGAVDMGRRTREALRDAGVELRAFA